MRNVIFGGLIVGLGIGLIDALRVVLTGGLSDALFALRMLGDIVFFQRQLFGWSFGLLGALWYGGLDVIQHYTLRLILNLQGHTPANYARFLDYAVDRIFLQKVGGGYRFIHRLLLEHFAEMGNPERL